MNGRGGSVGRWVQPRAVVLALVVVGFILSYLFLAPSPRRVPGLLVTDATDILVQRVNKIPFEEVRGRSSRPLVSQVVELDDFAHATRRRPLVLGAFWSHDPF